jgi:hypothetical protein
MSGRFRKAIGLAKKGLNNGLQEYEIVKSQLDTNPNDIQDPDDPFDLFKTTTEIFEKLRKKAH